MYNIIELENMEDVQLHATAAELGIKKPENQEREALIYDILDQQAIVKAAADAQRLPKKRGRKPAEAQAQPASEAAAQPKKRGRKPKAAVEAAPVETPAEAHVKKPRAPRKKKAEEITKEEKYDLQNTEKTVNDLRDKKNEIIANHAKDNKVVHELIDLALLQNGMLKGAALDKFLKRSVEMIG